MHVFYLFMYPLAHKASFIPTMWNLQSDGKRNSLGKAQLDKLLSVLLFALCQKALHLYPQGLPPLWSHLSPPLVL